MSQPTASERQLDFILKLITERAVRNDVADPKAAVDAMRQMRLTKTGASAVIDRLLAQPADPQPEAEQAQPETPAVRENRYPGACGNCGKRVQSGEGRIERVNGRWVTFHLDGECPTDLQTKLNELVGNLPDGYFAIPFIGRDADRTDLTFLGVRTRRNGDRFIVHVVGGHGETDDLSFDWCERAVAALRIVDLEAAAALYGRELNHCGKCGRTLTNVESRAIGIGPECATQAF